MLKNRSILISLLAISLLIFVSFACKSSSTKTDSPVNPTADQPSETKTYNKKVKVKTPDDKTIVEVKIDTDPKIEYAGKVVRSETKGDKRKYSVEGGSQIAEVKTKDADGFKVRTNDGQLLWKVKFADGKIKISNNEENENAFEIKKKDDGAKIERNETKLGEVKFYTDRQKVKVKDAGDVELFDSNTDKYSVAFGVLALNEIPEDYRFIIFAELLARNL